LSVFLAYHTRTVWLS